MLLPRIVATTAVLAAALIITIISSPCVAFSNNFCKKQQSSRHIIITPSSPPHSPLLLFAHNDDGYDDDALNRNGNSDNTHASSIIQRRSFLSNIAAGSSIIYSSSLITSSASYAATDEEESGSSFESIAARAARVSAEVEEAEIAKEAADETATQRRKDAAQKLRDDKRNIYDFMLPINGKAREVAEVIDQTFDEGDGGDGWSGGGEGMSDYGTTMGTRVKAILVVNIKQDDPIARKNIPELIALVSKFNKNGEFAVIVSPSDQGYYEPDTSALLRLKVEQEYGYGNTPGTILTDKVNLLGTGALPFWRWLEGSCRTPAGLGKIQANFEKFLIDGRTGKPLRRYPRKYQPYDIADDIAALIKGKPLPPAGANWKEEWRNAAKEAENDTYRFQKGLNYFDQ